MQQLVDGRIALTIEDMDALSPSRLIPCPPWCLPLTFPTMCLSPSRLCTQAVLHRQRCAGPQLLLEKVFVYGFNSRYNGISLGTPLATIKFAILDMLGRIVNKSMGQLIGDIHHRDVAVYQATEYREKSVEESMDLIQRDVAEFHANAVKIKIGALMFMTTDIHAVGPRGRTERMIPLLRKTFGDQMALYADANGFYSVEEAIRVGRLLEEYRYGFFEEPVMFDWHEETKQVADASPCRSHSVNRNIACTGFAGSSPTMRCEWCSRTTTTSVE